MTDLERSLVESLITAASPLYWQLIFAVALVVGYFFWSRLYFQVLDPAVRDRIGAALGLKLIWVLRHSASYQTAFEWGSVRYHRWSWGIALEHQRTFLRDGLVVVLSLVCVNIIAGLWPLAVFLVVALELKALAYVTFFPTCCAMLALYAIFWSGRYEVAGMREAGPPKISES
ncbi:MAG: hypothetical protein CYG59_02690 [Chloroflexi bacterium]|nr:MAG: hypothetical protein CYG59_02690 [Chloroflexota bacterium]